MMGLRLPETKLVGHAPIRAYFTASSRALLGDPRSCGTAGTSLIGCPRPPGGGSRAATKVDAWIIVGAFGLDIAYIMLIKPFARN
jgi:hypothetical protein